MTKHEFVRNALRAMITSSPPGQELNYDDLAQGVLAAVDEWQDQQPKGISWLDRLVVRMAPKTIAGQVLYPFTVQKNNKRIDVVACEMNGRWRVYKLVEGFVANWNVTQGCQWNTLQEATDFLVKRGWKI